MEGFGANGYTAVMDLLDSVEAAYGGSTEEDSGS